MKKYLTTKFITYSAIIAALYTVLTLLPMLFGVGIISFGAIQIRVSEALTILPAFTPAAIPGLFIGCLISNTIGVMFGLGAGLLDVIFGSLATLTAAYLSYLLRNKKWLVPLPPVLINAVVVGFLLNYVLGWPLLATMLWVGLGQVGACYVIGMPLYFVLDKNRRNIFKN
ncbi:MAG: QueT transporter family protein [Clostridiales bacterium]|nr:QueT transporter family protein [Clostridiales bacterium]